MLDDSKNPNNIFWNCIYENEYRLKKAMLIGLVSLIGGIILLIFAWNVFGIGFFTTLLIVYGTVYFIMNYKAYQVVQRIRRKKYIHDNDLNELKRIPFRGY